MVSCDPTSGKLRNEMKRVSMFDIAGKDGNIAEVDEITDECVAKDPMIRAIRKLGKLTEVTWIK